MSEQPGDEDRVSAIEQTLAEDLGRLTAGDMTFAQFRNQLANLLYRGTVAAADVSMWLGLVKDSGRLPGNLCEMLDGDVRRISSEDVPTVVDVVDDGGDDDPDARTTTEVSGDALAAAELRSAHRLEAGDVLSSRYKIVERLHGGNMSSVYKARDFVEDQDVAVKLLRAEWSASGRAVRALQDEYEKGRDCQHASIVRYLALSRHEDVFFVVMEWLDGEHLADRLNREPGVGQPYDWSFSIVERLAAALNAIHQRGYVHADVKPGNVMLLNNGDVRLFDFGVARAYGQHARERVAFDAGVLGAATPAYSSAAVLAGEPATPSDDLYSLACLFYRALAGRRPYGELTARAARDRNIVPARLESLPEPAWSLLLSALSHEAAERPASLTEFIDGMRPDDVVTEEGEEPTRSSGRALLIAAGVAAFAIAAVLFVWRGDEDDSAAPSTSAEPLAAAPADAEPDASLAAPVLPPEAVVEAADTTDASLPPVVVAAEEPPVDAPAPGDDVELVPADAAAADTELADAAEPPATAVAAVDAGDSPPIEPDEAGELDVTADLAASVPPSAPDSLRPLARAEETLTLIETDAPITLTFDAADAGYTALGVYLNTLTRDEHRQTLSLTDSGQVPVVDGVLRVRLAPRASWIDAPPREYRLLITTPDTAAVLATVPIRVLDQNPVTVSATPAVTEPDEAAVEPPATAEPVQTPVVATAGRRGVGFAVSQLTVRENDRVVRLPIEHRDFAPGLVRLVVDAGTADEEEDFVAPLPGALVVNIGTESATPEIRIALVNDSEPEGDETFRVRLVEPPLSGNPLASELDVVIVDDD